MALPLTIQTIHTFYCFVARCIQFFNRITQRSPGTLATAIVIFAAFIMAAAFTIVVAATTMLTFGIYIAADADLTFARCTKTAAAVVAHRTIHIFVAFGANGFDWDTVVGAANVICFDTSDNGALIGAFTFVTQPCFALGIFGTGFINAFFT